MSIDDTGASVEDDEAFDEERAAAMVRIIGAAVMEVYETSHLLEPVPGSDDE